MEVRDWEGSDGTTDLELNSEDSNDDELSYMPSCIQKLQFRKDMSVARWDQMMGMAEVTLKKGGMWATTGIIRQSKLYCLIEEVLFFAERGALILMDTDDRTFSLRDIYGLTVEGFHGCSWKSFEAYKHLKSLGYILVRHGLPWTISSRKNCIDSASLGETPVSRGRSDGDLGDDISCSLNYLRIGEQKPTFDMHLTGATVRHGRADRDSQEDISCLLDDLQDGEEKPTFDVHLPNRRFRKSSPGDPNFMVFVARDNLPSRSQIEKLERCTKGIPLKVCHVEHGRVTAQVSTGPGRLLHET